MLDISECIPIGGHRGMEVLRCKDGSILKHLIDRDLAPSYSSNGNWAGLQNEAKFLRVMSGSGFTPELLGEGEDWIAQTDLGISEPMRNGETFRRNCILLLAELRRRNVRHGDLTSVNIVLRNEYPFAVDWQEAHFIGESAPQKQPFSDSYLLWGTIGGTISQETQSFDVPRVARRWLSVLGALGATFNLTLPLKGKSLLDLGCYQGDFCAAAQVEGMKSVGIDMGGFRSGEDSIAIARELWGNLGCTFLKKDIMDVSPQELECDYVLLFSTWAYLVRDYGYPKALGLLKKLLDNSEVLFFESQLYGDGPGPEIFKSDEDIEAMFKELGASVKSLITIPVWGRPASRTVWGVRK